MRRSSSRRGFALVTVLFVLLALLVLCAPFLLTARNADRASGQIADRAQARLALDGAARHARASLGGSHPAKDPNVYFDTLDELHVDNRFDDAFLDANDATGVMWDLDVEDVAGRVDLNSASPQMFANVMGAGTRLKQPLESAGGEMLLHDTSAFPEEGGVVWINGEFISYAAVEGDKEPKLVGLDRGLGARLSDEDKWTTQGPRPPAGHGVGGHVLDQRAFAPVVWRTSVAGGEPREFDAVEQLREAQQFVLSGELDGASFRALEEVGTVFGGIRAGSRWQRAARLTAPVEGGVSYALQVDDGRWFNEGATVRITDGEVSELRYVARRGRGGLLVLDQALLEDYDAYRAVVEVLIRRPVNINTASPAVLEALFNGLQIRGRNDRITGTEARALAARVAVLRPFEGFEDFLRRLVLPAAGIDEAEGSDAEDAAEVLIDPHDALALYINGLNANDFRLVYSTMPFAFTSREVFRMELRASINAKSGVERVALARERVELVTPQEPLFTMFARQEDFDEALRLTRDAPWWATGPEVTSRYDGTVVPPSRVYAHMGTLDGQVYIPGISETRTTDDGEASQAEHVFASREDDGFAQLWPARLEDVHQWEGRTIHFDQESRDLEGRFLPDQPILRPADDEQVFWTDQGESMLLRALCFNMWLRPDEVSDGSLFEVGGTSDDVDRVSLLLEGEDLVLRVRDGYGDHPGSPEVEAAEVRMLLNGAEVPGLPAQTWSHLDVQVAGTRPDQVDMLVNGTAHGVRRLGLTRTTGTVTATDGLIPVESTEGFPPVGVARLGNELIEYTVSGDSALNATFADAGPRAGFGGRFARLRHDIEGSDEASLPLDLNSGGLTSDYPAGTTVSVYGYSGRLFTNLPTGGATLPAPLGAFRVARVLEVGDGFQMDPIFAGPYEIDWGKGLEATSLYSLELSLADDSYGTGAGDDSVARAFNPNGGYAALVQVRWRAGTDAADGLSSTSGAPLGGVEVVRYSGVSGNALQLAARGDQVASELERLGAIQGDDFIGGSRAFVFEWRGQVQFDDEAAARQMTRGTYVVPISIPAPGATDLNFLPPQNGRSEFAQITRTDQAEMTEWVRYDEVQMSFGQLVRDDVGALADLHAAITRGGQDILDPQRPETPIGGGGGLGGGGAGGGGVQMFGSTPAPGAPVFDLGASYAPEPASPSRAPEHAAPRVGVNWEPWLGRDELEDLPLTRAVAQRFHFRGVLGTHTHDQPAGALITPVFQMLDRGVAAGRLGANDYVFAVGPTPDHPGWPLTVHRAHHAAPVRVVHTWEPAEGEPVAVALDETADVGQGEYQGRLYVALREFCPEPIAAGSITGQVLPGQGNPGFPGQQQLVDANDARLVARIVKFPSGERPRIVSEVSVGGGGQGGVVPAVVDELSFFTPRFGVGLAGASPAYAAQGASLILVTDLGEQDDVMLVAPRTARTAGGNWGHPADLLTELPEDGGLLRIGEEIVCYESRDPSTGAFVIAPGGRGLLGTREQPHVVTEPVVWLEHIPVTTLAGGVSGGDGTLSVVSVDGFPSQGTLLIGEELVHYTRTRGGAFEMPRASSEPGRMDEQGDGLFRGRFGTVPSVHEGGAPVILFPFRYWDRWTDRADAPELAYFGLELEQPAAWWHSMFWDAEPAGHGQASIGVLQRTDPSVPWDADPDEWDGLDVLWEGRVGDEEIPIDVQSDRVQWRVFVRYDPRAYDAREGLSHGWKETPRFRRLGATYEGPSRVLRSADE